MNELIDFANELVLDLIEVKNFEVWVLKVVQAPEAQEEIDDFEEVEGAFVSTLTFSWVAICDRIYLLYEDRWDRSWGVDHADPGRDCSKP